MRRDAEPSGDLIDSERAAFQKLCRLGVDRPRRDLQLAVDDADAACVGLTAGFAVQGFFDRGGFVFGQRVFGVTIADASSPF